MDSKKLEKATTKNDLGVDCISRAQTQTEIEMNAFRYTLAKERGGMGEVEWNSHLIAIDDVVDIIRNLPSVTPQEPRKGHWIKEESISGWDGHSYQCSVCGRSIHLDVVVEALADYPYCHCGADMREVEE